MSFWFVVPVEPTVLPGDNGVGRPAWIAAGGRFYRSLQARFLPVAGRLHPGSFSAWAGFPGPVGVLFCVCV